MSTCIPGVGAGSVSSPVDDWFERYYLNAASIPFELHQGHIPGTPCLPGCPEWKPLPGIRRT